MAERIEHEVQDKVEVYDTRNGEVDRRRLGYGSTSIPTDVVNTTIVNPTDRVRWGPIFAGIFAALTSLVVLGVLGLAIGLSTYDPGDPLSSFGWGAGVWGIVSTILAFLIGGWVAARTAPPMGRGMAVMNSTMVWVVAIPLMLYFLGTGLGSLLNMATQAAATGAAVAAPAVGAIAGQAANQPQAQATVQTGAAELGQAAQATATAVAVQLPATVAKTAETASSAAWSTLLVLLLGLVAAAFGGLLGAREPRIQTQLVTA